MRQSVVDEIAELVKARDNLRVKEFEMRQGRKNTRANVTTMNAKISRVNDIIHALRQYEKTKK